MKINALMIDETDNVVTCVEEVSAGSGVFYRKGSEILSVKALEDIPYCHKVALKDFEVVSTSMSILSYLKNKKDEIEQQIVNTNTEIAGIKEKMTS